MRALDQLPGNAVGEEGLAHSRVPVKEQVGGRSVKAPDKLMTDINGFFHTFQRRHVGFGIPDIIGIIIIGKQIKIFLIQNRPDIGLVIKQLDLCFFEAAAFLTVDKAGVLTVRAVIRQTQIIFGIPGIF